MSGRLRRHALAVIVFVGGCILSAGLSGYSRQAIDRADRVRFDLETTLVSGFISARLERYVNALIHTKALFAVENRISRTQFRRYIDDLDVFQKYPGTLGIGYAERIGGNLLVRSVEPQGAFSQRTVGRDLHEGPIGDEAIARAERSGQPTMSGRIMIPGAEPEPGFLLLNPIYERGKSTETSDLRAQAVAGFVFSLFRVHTLFDDLFSENSVDPAIDLDVYDGESLSRASLLFQRYPSAVAPANHYEFERLRKFTVAGRTWSIDYRALPQLRSGWARFSPDIFFGVGLLISYLLAQLLWSMQTRIDSERALSDRVRQAIASRDEFISIASHELKTPITSLKLQLAMASRYPEKAAQLIDVGDKQATRLNRLIDELLDMTRIQAGKMKYEFESADLTELVREITDRCQEQMKEAGCELRLTASSPVVAEVDRFRIEQVVVNLLSNAMKYGRGQPVDIWVERDGPNAVIRVTDHGRGIALEKQELVFKRFERLGAEKTISGLGLGLYISKQIVDAHDGGIRVQSQAGQGSTFTVELPIHRASR